MRHFYIIPALCLLILINSCSAPKPLQYKEINGFAVKNVSLKQPSVILNINYYNPNNYSLSLKDGNIDVFVNEIYLGKAAVDTRVTAPALGNFNIPIEVGLDIDKIFKNAVTLVLNPDVTIRLKGSVKVGKGVFVSVPIDFVTTQRINIR